MELTRQSRRAPAPELNMAAMIDVVFLLLIFFMCTSAFRGIEQELPASLPSGSGIDDLARREFDPVRIRLERLPDGVLVLCDGQPCASFDDLFEKLRARRAVADLPVVIEGQARIPFRYMVAAMDTCFRADLRRVAFSARGTGE